MRAIPKSIVESWERLPSEAPLVALSSSHALHRQLARWQADLVREALASDANWEDIGAALGTSKQGAWARFRTLLDEKGESQVMGSEGRHLAQQRVRQVQQIGKARLREMDAKSRQEQLRLRQQIRQSQKELNETKQRHAREHRAAREQLRREIESARASART